LAGGWTRGGAKPVTVRVITGAATFAALAKGRLLIAVIFRV